MEMLSGPKSMIEDITDEVMRMAISCASDSMKKGKGGPFGAAVIAPDGNIYYGSNEVLERKDPTAHAEVVAIRNAAQGLGTYDLKGCVLYATCQPCPMCLSAIIWANIKNIVYSCSAEDAAKCGFRDDEIYTYIKSDCTTELLKIQRVERPDAKQLFEDYISMSGTVY